MFECPDCGRNDYNSLRAAMLCPCDRYDRNGRDKPVPGGDWIP